MNKYNWQNALFQATEIIILIEENRVTAFDLISIKNIYDDASDFGLSGLNGLNSNEIKKFQTRFLMIEDILITLGVEIPTQNL